MTHSSLLQVFMYNVLFSITKAEDKNGVGFREGISFINEKTEAYSDYITYWRSHN